MTCLAVETEFSPSRTDTWTLVRTSVFWGFILLVIASPAALGALILANG
jgi:hypothetical protein